MQTDKDKLNDSYAALERKAALYDRLSQGRCDDEEEQYNVDFLQKGFLTDEMQPDIRHRSAHDPAEPIDTSAMAMRASGVLLNPSLNFFTVRLHARDFTVCTCQKGRPARHQMLNVVYNCAVYLGMHFLHSFTHGL